MAWTDGHRSTMGYPIHMRIIISRPSRTCDRRILSLAIGGIALLLSGCHLLGNERVVFNERGLRVGIETDPSVNRASPPALNEHPGRLTPQDIQILLGPIRVSGWSGTVVGWFDQPRPIPLFDDADLQAVARPIADALQEALPSQRVVFYLSNPKSAYGDATSGALFLRHQALHLVVTDHKAFSRADTAGGDEKDLRDTKGMTLSLVRPYQAAGLRPAEEPDWAPFERVHLSVNVKALLTQAQQSVPGITATGQTRPVPPTPQPATVTEPSEVSQDLRPQIRELTQSNLDLRDRLNRQTEQLQQLQEELTKLRRDSESSRLKKSPARKPVAP